MVAMMVGIPTLLSSIMKLAIDRLQRRYEASVKREEFIR